ncbi:MAG: ATP-binding protein [Methanobrevibacter sp.]|nr:ATP-binding protein [Methanosphaera sp.]MBR0059734.1 ATP-binding protein [Methanobrevibacter sp.]
MNSKPLFLHNNLDEYFYNRKEDIKKLKYQIDSLNYSLPQQILLTGYRGVGKTYLLKKIMTEIEPNIICIYIDIAQLYARTKEELTIETVLIELLKEMNQSIKTNNYKNKYKAKITELINNLKLKKYDFHDITTILDIPIPKSETNYGKLSQFVMEFPQKIVNEMDELNGFVIIIDEFQMLRKINHLDKFFWLIRSYNQTQHNVSYIFTGSISRSSNIINELNGESGAFGGRLQQITINPFSKEETKAYFKDKMSEIKFTEEGFERFYKCTRGIPLYINSFYNVMDSNQIYTPEIVKKTFFTNMEQILIMWIKIWSSLNKNEKNIVEQLVEEDSLTWSELLEKINISRGTFNKYLTSLKDKGIISYANQKYSIEDEMLKTWLNYEKEVYGIYPL